MAALLATSAASAAGGVGGKGDTGGGKGGLGPSNSTTSGAAGTAEAPAELDTSGQAFGGRSTQNPDVTNNKKVEEKPWEVGATFETHRLLRQDYNLDGTGALKVFNVLYAVAKYSLTDYDTILLSGGGYQYFLADSGESGFRSTDLSLGYTHMFQLPARFRLRTAVGATIPISYDSQLASNITSPSVSVALSRKFGDLALEARITGRYFWDRYTTANAIGGSNNNDTSGSGQPNTEWSAGAAISAEYDMPFYRPLSAGVALVDSYVGFYNVGQCPADSGLGQAYGGGANSCPGATTNKAIDNNPWQQSYGGEVFVRYVMPDLGGFKSDLTVALANGDPSLGYPSVLHDGIVHP
ncbi:MAG TPA: hypothetical protein VIY73_26205, partial [Polyangiaceae bacterium]